MWNSFLDKAIKAAEVLDKQLNESVGVTATDDTKLNSTVGTLNSAATSLLSDDLLPANHDSSEITDGFVGEDWDEEDHQASNEENNVLADHSSDKRQTMETVEPANADENYQETIEDIKISSMQEKDEGWDEDEIEIEDNHTEYPAQSSNEKTLEIMSTETVIQTPELLQEKTDDSNENEKNVNVFVQSQSPTEGELEEFEGTGQPVQISETITHPSVENITHNGSVVTVLLNEEAVIKPFVPEVNLELIENEILMEHKEHVHEEKGELRIQPETKVVPHTISHNDEGVNPDHGAKCLLLERQVEELTQLLSQREMQLLSKNEQLVEIEAAFENERDDLLRKIQSTKDEAKRRISKAKERVDAVENQLQAISMSQSGSAETMAQKDEIISALRSEGEKLARKQADMEKAVRVAKSESRELREKLEEIFIVKEEGLQKISSLESELANVREALTSARQGESQADKLDSELRQVRDESERRQATIMSLEQNIKELKSKTKNLQIELEESKKGAAVESEQERKKLLKEQSELVKELENTIRVTEREASLREDGLRHEVEEIRKRWQDAVRRADSLSIDIQSSTAPLLRQLESVNKQNRARASAWAELETQLRSELEENVVLNEKLSKERNDLKSKFSRIERLYKEQDEELKKLKKSLEEKSHQADQLVDQLTRMEEESSKMKEEWAEVERLANEGISRVRSEMTKTVVESEERYRSQLESVKSDLNQEREMRRQLELQLEGLLLDNAGLFIPQDVPTQALVKEDAKPKKLLQSEGQASILANTLGGLMQDSDDEMDENDADNEFHHGSNGGSFAALDQLTSSLKAAKNELQLLRMRLQSSEKTREELVESLAECRNAKEKLPLFEAKVKELTDNNIELTLEVRGLREDIADVRELYRTQLNLLIEEKASSTTADLAPKIIVSDGHNADQGQDVAEEVGAPEESNHSTH